MFTVYTHVKHWEVLEKSFLNTITICRPYRLLFLFPVFVCVLIDESVESESSLESQVKTFREKVSVTELRHGIVSKFLLGLGFSISKMSWLNKAVSPVAPSSFICGRLDSFYLQRPPWLHKE